jgi:hypothetical protein
VRRRVGVRRPRGNACDGALLGGTDCGGRAVYPNISEAGGRSPLRLECMLRAYFLQLWFNLSDPAVGCLQRMRPIVSRCSTCCMGKKDEPGVFQRTVGRRPRSAPGRLGRRTLPTTVTGGANAFMSRPSPQTVTNPACEPMSSTCLRLSSWSSAFRRCVSRLGEEPAPTGGQRSAGESVPVAQEIDGRFQESCELGRLQLCVHIMCRRLK